MKKFSISIWLLLVVINWPGVCSGQSSVLSDGDWYKLAVYQTGIYRISYNDLLSYGISPSQINPKNVRIYGNGNGMLPEANDAFRYADLQENAILVVGEEDEIFNPEDYILFYGEGNVEWKFNEGSGLFRHQVNLYSDFTSYFLTIGEEPGKRIENQPEPSGVPSQDITLFNDFYSHEIENHNLIHSGKNWYGELFSEITTYNYNLSFPGLLNGYPIYLRSSITNRSFENCSMEIGVDGELVSSVVLTSVIPSSTKYAQKKIDSTSFVVDATDFLLSYSYIQPNDSAIAWLDFFEINYTCDLNLTDNQMNFRNIESVGSGMISNFILSGADISTQIWNVTDPLNIYKVEGVINNEQFEFKIETDSLLEFIALKGSDFETPVFSDQVENQNLHGLEPPDFLIVTYHDFIDAAEQLSAFHESNDGLTSFVVTPEIIYNEFSSGSQDVTAIRDFIKYLYDKSGGEKPKYLLLFGDGSYDPKNRIENNTNYVPVFQTSESLISSASYVVEDYFGYLDINEGFDGIGNPDIGVGRIPVKSLTEAFSAVDKIIEYSSSNGNFGSWKNDICLVADDSDGNLHLEQTESLSDSIAFYNINKLYLDFFDLVQTPEGPRYPEVNSRINEQMEEGVFFISFVGHGGNTGWAHERVLEAEDIESWNNEHKMPVMVAATCMFARFDEPEIISGGEQCILKNNGGSIGLFSNSRLAYAQTNFVINRNLVEFMLNEENQEIRLGDIIQYSKPFAQLTARTFVLLGDPALKISKPPLKVITETINGINISQPQDTLQPNEQINITGIITDYEGNIQDGFNGELFIQIFDRPYIKTTLGNQQYSYPVDVRMQDSILLEIETTVENGQFEYSFTLPSNLNTEYGKINLSHYAMNEILDASGYYSEIVVGGLPNAVSEPISESDLLSINPTIIFNDLIYTAHQDIQNLEIVVLDVSGKETVSYSSSHNLKGESNRIDLSLLSKGFYIIHVTADNRQIIRKILKQ